MKRAGLLLLRAVVAALLLGALSSDVASADPGTFHVVMPSSDVVVTPDVFVPEDPGLTRLPEDPGLTRLPEDPGFE
jgi:hypothetical protein